MSVDLLTYFKAWLHFSQFCFNVLWKHANKPKC
jgi:hypothetical protein